MDDPWFTYFRGRGRMQVTPRNGKGWAALAAFVLVVTGAAIVIGPSIDRDPWLFVPFLVGMALLTIGFIRFAIGKSERVDLDMSAKELEEFRAWKQRGKR